MKTVETTVLADFVRDVRDTTGGLLAVADIGASTVRFALVGGVKHGQTVKFIKFSKIRSVGSLLKVLKVIESAVGTEVSNRIKAGAVAVPGPVQQNQAVIANYKAETTEGRTLDMKSLPHTLFPPSRSVMLNDVEAAGYGVIGLGAVGDLDVFRMLWASKQTPRAGVTLKTIPEGHILIVAPGTGLGSCLLHHHPRSVGTADRFSVLPLEFGHTTVPQHEDTALLKEFEKELGFVTEYDDVCTGRGLEFAYRHHSNGRKLAAPEISKLAKEGDDVARLAMRTYHHFIMLFCANLIMGLQPALVVLIGDNVINNSFFFDSEQNVHAMRDDLLKHSTERMGFMSRPGMALLTERINLNLIGCLYAASTTKGPGEEAPRAKL